VRSIAVYEKQVVGYRFSVLGRRFSLPSQKHEQKFTAFLKLAASLRSVIPSAPLALSEAEGEGSAFQIGNRQSAIGNGFDPLTANRQPRTDPGFSHRQSIINNRKCSGLP
jgi:hypothetical protein